MRVVVGMLWVNWPQGFWGQVYCSCWNLAAVLYGWKVGLVWLLCVSDGCISGVLGVRFLDALSVLVGGSGFCETEKTQCRNDRVGSYSCHHVDGCYQGEMVYGDGQECSLRLTSTTVSAPLLYVHQCLSKVWVWLQQPALPQQVCWQLGILTPLVAQDTMTIMLWKSRCSKA